MKKLFLVLLLILVGYLIWRWWHGRDQSAASSQGGEALVYDRLWVDHLPRSETEPFQLFAAITEQPIGIFQSSSLWKGSWELFRYEPRGDGALEILYPQSKDKERVRYHATACRQKEFDYCLELDGASRGVKRYFSQRGWEIGGARSPEALRQRVDALLPAPH